jgi:hypothetical protein
MLYGVEAISMQGEIMLAYTAPKENRGAGVGDLPKEMEVDPIHGQR